jgi:chromosome segregation ATPase
MADNKKIYSIQINGIDQSIKQVDALSDALQNLDKKIKDLESRSVNITSSNSGGSSRNADLQTEDKLLKQIQSTEQQIKDARREDYASLLAQKDILKDIVDETKQRAAQERLSVGRYDNSMKGLKQELSDIKSVMQTTDLGSDKFNDLTKRAGELTNKLKDLEQAYGQFGRNVGNYASAAEGFKGIQVNVGGVVREFENAREASRTLNNELKTMAVNGQSDTEEFKNLRQAVMQMESAMNDAKKPMDDLMDAMESFTAIASVSEGISALFGIDDSEIQRSIQKLLALQNVLKGIETINKQMQTGEGIGSWLSKGSEMADKMAASIVGVGKASKGATVATKALGTAFKALGIGAVIAGVMELIHIVEVWSEKQKKAAEEAEEAAEKTKKAIDEQRNSFVGASATYMNTASRLSHLRAEYMTTNNEMRKTSIIKEATEIFKKFGISVKSVTDAQNILVNQGDKVIEMIRLQGDAAALAALRMEAFKKSFNMLLENGYDVRGASILAGNSGMVVELDKQLDKVSQSLSNLQKELGVNTKNSSNSLKKTVVDAEALIAKARVDAMKQGFVKTLAQLKLERDRRIAEAKKTGKLVQEQIELINKQYQDKVFEARVQYHTNLINEEKKYVEKIENLNEEMYQKEVEISRKRNELELEKNIDNMSFKKAVDSTTLSDGSVVDMDALYERGMRNVTYDYNFELPPKVLRDYKDLADKLSYVQYILDTLDTDAEENVEAIKALEKEVVYLTNKLEEYGKKYPEIAQAAEKLVATTLNGAIEERTAAIEGHYKAVLLYAQDAADEELRIEKEKLATELRLVNENEKKRHQLMISRYYEDDKDSEAETKRRNSVYKTPRTAFETYMEEDAKGNLLGKNSDQLGKYFSEYRKQMDEWVDSFKKAVKEEEITWEEYFEFMNQEAIQGYLKAKTEYDNFLTLYNKMSDEEKAEKEGDLKELTRNLNNAYAAYLDKIREEQQTHDNQMKVIQNKYNVDVEQADKEHHDRRKQAIIDYHSQMINEYERAMSAISNKIDKAVTKNAWGIINYGATKDALKDLQESINTTINKIEDEKKNLVTRLAEGEISFGDFSTLMDQLNTLEVQAQDTAKNVSTKLKELTGEWWGSIDQWVQAVGQTMNTILSSLSEIQSNQYDKMIEQQEKYIEEYEKQLDKQKDITQEHASAVESIEDELSTARGDRRQHLIDQLNAEMAAQRASLAQEKKIEREREKAEQKKKKLEHDQAVAKKKMQLAQAAINMAMSISMAAVNSWPVPAIPMMALAAAAGAAQIAAIQSQNIPSYGSGGVIQGKSHREGGVKVLGGQAEVEGGEFITNKVTTSKNVDLLEFINGKRKKINLEDLIDFYGGSSSVKKNIQTVRTKFADGGVVPQLRTDINLSDRMLTAFEDYSNRPVQVAVVDIIDRTQQVNDVKVMAGLDV